MIRRHSATAIFMHWYNAACWLLLLFTGFALLANPLMQPVGDWWSSLWTGAFGALGLLRLHVVVGMAWIVLYAAYLLVRARAEALPFLKEITDLHIGSDLVWCLRKGLWLVLGERLMRRLGLDPELPPQGFYNAGQKLVAIIAVLCSLGLALTGLILVFASGRPETEGLLQICLLAHFCCAGLMAVFLPVHIYMAAFAPGAAVHVHRIRAAGAHQAPQPAVVPQAGGTGKGIGPVSFETVGRHRGRGTLLETTLFPPQTRQCGVHSSLFKGVCVD